MVSYLVAISYFENFITTQPEISLPIYCNSEHLFKVIPNLAGHLTMITISMIFRAFRVVVILQDTRLFEAGILLNYLLQHWYIHVRTDLVLNSNSQVSQMILHRYFFHYLSILSNYSVSFLRKLLNKLLLEIRYSIKFIGAKNIDCLSYADFLR